ncbi:MAG: hypothetical protein KBT32_04985 [Bacteroidales bacterium]|nr:hypothetical protein [Candidatus Physcocola equi]
MKQIPNCIVVLDFVQSRVVKIKLSYEDKRSASSCDDLEKWVDVYH